MPDPSARPLPQEVDEVGEHKGFFEVVGDQEHADFFTFDEVEQILGDAMPDDRVERREGFVHQQKARPERQHLRQRDALALAAAQRSGKAPAQTDEAQFTEPRFGLVAGMRAWLAADAQTERHIIKRRAPRQQRVVLEENPHITAIEVAGDRTGARPQ